MTEPNSTYTLDRAAPRAGCRAARQEASYRQETDANETELRRLDLERDRRMEPRLNVPEGGVA